ncbi:MAG: hypothetical protein OEV43_06515 [Coriobacteriia bacterium]|nr:hypothetical protein [Coriobacteriia bacterium]
MRLPLTRRAWTSAGVAAAVLAALLFTGFYFYLRGGGPVPSWVPIRPAIQDPLAPSEPPEQVLRSMRLAGFERAVAGEGAGFAIVRVEVPSVGSPADVEIAWQTGAASLAEAYPDAGRYVVQVFDPSQALVEVRWDGDSARDAVTADDAGALFSSAQFVHLTGEVSE